MWFKNYFFSTLTLTNNSSITTTTKITITTTNIGINSEASFNFYDTKCIACYLKCK